MQLVHVSGAPIINLSSSSPISLYYKHPTRGIWSWRIRGNLGGHVQILSSDVRHVVRVSQPTNCFPHCTAPSCSQPNHIISKYHLAPLSFSMAYYARPPIDDHEHLPTYEAATTRDPIPLFGRHLRRQDVFTASLVCHGWRAALMPILWETPHRYWGMGERNQMSALSSSSRAP